MRDFDQTVLSRFGADFRVAFRSLRREWASSLFIILTLGLGIGANAAMFNVVDRLLVTGPEGIRDPQRVLGLHWTAIEAGTQPTTSSIFDFAALDAMRRGSRSVENVAAYITTIATLGRGREAQQIRAGYVSDGFFKTLGATPLAGLSLDADGAGPTATTLAVISYGLWQSAFGGAVNVLGRAIIINDRSYTIAGVMPSGFTGAETTKTDLWIAYENIGVTLDSTWRTDWDAASAFLVARLKPGVSDDQASAELTAAFRHAYGGTEQGMKVATISMAPLTRNPRKDWSPEASLSMWLAFLSLAAVIIAGANVANLLSARATRRRQSLGVRVALGASRGDIARLFIAEGLLLAFAGGVAALAVAYAVGIPIRRELLPDVAWISPIVNLRIVLLVLCAVLLLGVTVGIVPARKVFGTQLTVLLQMVEGRGARNNVGRVLTLIQSALSTVLLVGAGLFVHSLLIARAIDSGVDPAHAVAVTVRWPRVTSDRGAARTAEFNRRATFLHEAADRLRGLPSMSSVAIGMGVPFAGGGAFSKLKSTDGPLAGKALDPGPSLYAVSDHYFETIGTRIEEGRPIDASDRATGPRVVVISRALAARLWPGQPALGRCVKVVADTLPCAIVVGVSADIRRVRGPIRTEVYTPLAQTTALDNMMLVVRTDTPIDRVAPIVRRALTELDPSIDYINVATLQSSIDPGLRPWQMGALMFGLVGALAFVIAAVGLYGVVSYNTERKEQEMGIRRALGATSSNIAALIMRASVGASAAGVLLGVVISIAGGRYLQSFLYTGIGHDPLVIAIVSATLIATAIMAAIIPAIRILRRSPAEALRAN